MVREICLDSNILIELLRNNPEVISSLKNVEANFSTTSINIFEVWGGRQEKEEEIIRNLFSWLKVIKFDKEEAIIAGNVMKGLKSIGEIIDFRDVFIASICIKNAQELLTLNKKDFVRMKKFGLKLVD